MAKLLRNKLALALCCSVVMGTTAQGAPLVVEQNAQDIDYTINEGVEVTTGSSLVMIPEVEDIEEEVNTGEDLWESKVAAADHLGDIKVLHETNNTPSMAAQFFTQEDLPISIQDGKVYVTLRIEKDGWGFEDIIGSLSQCIENEYQEIELEYMADESIRFVTATICVSDITETEFFKCHIVPMGGAPTLRIQFTDETIDYLKEVLEQEDQGQEESIQIEDGTYLVDLDFLKVGTDEASHSANSFYTTDIALTIREGEGYLALVVKRDSGAFTDMVGGLEQVVNGEEIPLELVYTEVNGERVAVAEIALSSLEGRETIVCHIINPFTHSPSLDVQVSAASIEAIKKGTSEQITPVTVNATKDKDGMSIIASATGGSGSYEYSINGGVEWQDTSEFSGLEEGVYQVVARDAMQPLNVSSIQEMILGEESIQVADGTYLVDIEVLHETEDQESHAAAYFKKEEVSLVVKDGKGYLTVKVQRDSGNFTNMIQSLAQKEGDSYRELELTYIEEDGERLIVAQIQLDSVVDIAYVNTKVVLPFMSKEYDVRIRLTQDSVSELTNGTAVHAVTMTVAHTDAVGMANGTITVKATGGSGSYEYSIDGGITWQKESIFTGLGAGTYQVISRDANHISNIASGQSITLTQKDSNTNVEELADGQYSVDIRVLQENSNQASMAASFFNKEGLPLEIINGKAYLTIQVLKDGMGMTDVITSLEQRINGSYQDLDLAYFNDSSKRYVTAEVVFDHVNGEAYLRCGILPMGDMKPVLRIVLDTDSIQVGMGSIDSDLKSDVESSITSVVAENGKVKIKLSSEDEALTASDFTGKIYVDNKSEALTLKDFKMEGDEVSFTFEEVAAVALDQKVVVGITFNQVEMKSNEFIVKGTETGNSSITEVGLKENATEVKYIVGYEDGTFRPSSQVTKAEVVSMLASLIDVPDRDYYSANMAVLHSEKDEASMAAPFFKTEAIQIEKTEDHYVVQLEIANEGLGFTNIITGVEQRIGDTFVALEVRKSSDLQKAYVTLEIEDLSEAIVLKTGIAPMGSMAPELRVIIDEASLKVSTYQSQFTDVEMWAKEDIILFESLGLIGNQGEVSFNPDEAMTRSECVRLITLISGLPISAANEHLFTDVVDHAHEKYIAAAYEEGLIKGYEDGTFRPDQTLSRAEAVAMINRFIGHDESTHVEIDNPFSDLAHNHWAYKEILKVAQL